MLVHLPDLGDILPLNSAALAPLLHLHPHYATGRVEFESLLGHRCSAVKNNQPSLRSLQRPLRKGKKSLQDKGNEKEGGTPKIDLHSASPPSRGYSPPPHTSASKFTASFMRLPE